ncbi:hypothetical protein BsWGS_18950 [Bradybaena similaris]
MNGLQISILTALLSLQLVTSPSSATVSDSASSRTKRQSADVRTAEYLAWIALGGKVPSQGCDEVACGVVDVHARVRRSSADQRIAELQALLALAGSRSRGTNTVAHGQFDPDVIGKKKRDPQYALISDEDRYNLLKSLIQKAAENTLS